MDSIKWCNCSIINFGDNINPILYNFITGKEPKSLSIHSKEPGYIMVGSVLEGAKKSDIVWGTGAMWGTNKINSDAKICAVRGPLTRKNLLMHGDSCPKVYGDPVLLLPRFVKPNVTKKYKLGIIPHYVDRNTVSKKVKLSSEFKLLNITIDPLEFINEVNECEAIVSSSLHGLILADAYGIPSKWVKFSEKVAGKGFKFRDYFASIGQPEDTKPIVFKNGLEDVDWNDILNKIEPYDIDIDLDKLMDACPFKIDK